MYLLLVGPPNSLPPKAGIALLNIKIMIQITAQIANSTTLEERLPAGTINWRFCFNRDKVDIN